jgi:predicted amidohydrolase
LSVREFVLKQGVMRIGLVQLNVTSSKKENLRRTVDAIESAGGISDLLVFPEYCMGYPDEGLSRNYVEKTAEPLDGEFITLVAEKSKEKQVAIVMPIFEKPNGGVFDTAVIINHGEVRGGYRKIHLFDALGYKESEYFRPGSEPALFKIGDTLLGVVICYDIRFPELVKSEVMSGARVIIVPSAWYRGPLKEEQWQTLLMARAQENTSYVIGVGNANEAFIGRSMVVDPLGVKVLDLGSGERIGFYDVDNRRVNEARKKLPVLKQSTDFHSFPCQEL